MKPLPGQSKTHSSNVQSAVPSPSNTQINPKKLSKLATDILEDAKAEDIVTLDLGGKTSIADVMILASGRSNRHVSSIADTMVEQLKHAGFKDIRVEGQQHCDWVLVDAGDMIIHIFRPEVREFYNLEKLWSPGAPDDTPAM